MKTDTMPGASGRTYCTVNWCRADAEQRGDHPVPDDQRGDRRVQGRPGHPGRVVGAERGAVGELVAERQRDRQVGVQVGVIPGLVLEAAARGPGREGGHAEQHEPGDGRHQHVRVRRQQRGGFARHLHVGGDRVAPDDERDVGGDQGDDVAAAHRVPAGEPVGADALLQRRQPGHQRDQDDEPVPGEQAEHVARGGDQGAGGGRPRGAAPPQGDHDQRAEADEGQHQHRQDHPGDPPAGPERPGRRRGRPGGGPLRRHRAGRMRRGAAAAAGNGGGAAGNGPVGADPVRIGPDRRGDRRPGWTDPGGAGGQAGGTEGSGPEGCSGHVPGRPPE